MKLTYLLLIGLIVTSCGAEDAAEEDKNDKEEVKEDPKVVEQKANEALAGEFTMAIETEDFDKAREMISSDSEEALNAIESLNEAAKVLNPDEEDVQLELVSVECEIAEGDKCHCDSHMSDGAIRPVELVKEGGNWKVKVVKEQPPTLDEEPTEEIGIAEESSH